MSYVENNKYRFPGKKKMEYVPSKLFPLSPKKKCIGLDTPTLQNLS
jgi:hypothetical protein